jgi:hypothetical protein
MSERRTILKLAAGADVDPRTAARFLRGEHVHPATRKALEASAKVLGLPIPSPETAAPSDEGVAA